MHVTTKITKQLLESYYVKYNICNSSKDPIWNLKKVHTKQDKEILAFIISCYTYGNIVQINKFVEKVLSFTTEDIYKFIISFKLSPKHSDYDFKYRFNTTADFMDLLNSLSKILKKYGSLKKLFLKYYEQDKGNILAALDGFTAEIRSLANGGKTFEYLVPVVSRKSTCKRLLLFLRWMVRRDNIDTGLWNAEVSTSDLLIPVDTHVFRIARKYKLVDRKTLDIKFSELLTEKLKQFDPIDPVKYDFALCHLGVDRAERF